MADDSDNESLSDGSPQRDSCGGEAGSAVPMPPVPDNSSVPKPKRLACMICRRRKLKCDGLRPSCGTCSRLKHECAYDEQRRKSGPKRGYVKALEERLKQVETMLQTKDQDTGSKAPPANRIGISMSGNHSPQTIGLQHMTGGATANLTVGGDDRWNFQSESPQPNSLDEFGFGNNMGMNINNVTGNFTWEMIGLGLEEPLPPQDTIDELHQIYFEKIHPTMPMIHRYRYLAAMNLAPTSRPPVCLRYAMWTLACSITGKYSDLTDLFYHRARKYIEADYVRGYGEHMISVAHCQTHVLLACYEMKMMHFPRAWMNTGAANRLAHMISLHRQDGGSLDVKQCLPPAKDWVEQEERRRTFWMAYCEDRYASIGTGWPMAVDERDITTNMPSSEEAFDLGRPEQTPTLEECMAPGGAVKLSTFGGIVVMACLFGRNLLHLHRPEANDKDDDLNGPFWKRHRELDNTILDISLGMPSKLKLPAGLGNPNAVFTNMSIHTSTICLHQAAIFKSERNKLPASVSSESKVRCITAANEIASIMRTTSHMDLTAMNPFVAFCLYVAARVFVQYLKSRPDDSQITDSLRFLLSAMNALKRHNPLTEAFVMQLEVDFDALVARVPHLKNTFNRSVTNPGTAQRVRESGKVDGPVGEEKEIHHGVIPYRNECHFMKVPGDDGNIGHAPELVEPQESTMQSSNSHTTTGPAKAGFESWMAGEPSISLMTPNSSSTYDRNGSARGTMSGFGGSNANANPDSQDASVDEAQSNNGPTPNSSGTGSDSRSHFAAGQMSGSAFQASPITSQQNIMMSGGPAAGMDVSDPAMFGDANAFGMTGGMSVPQGLFRMADCGWEDMPGQPGQDAGNDEVLRTLMNMGPMDAMDLSSWDANQRNLG